MKNSYGLPPTPISHRRMLLLKEEVGLVLRDLALVEDANRRRKPRLTGGMLSKLNRRLTSVKRMVRDARKGEEL